MSSERYNDVPIKESGEPLVDLRKFDFFLDQKYFRQGISNDSRMFLREGIAKRLERAQKSMKGYKIKIWDGFRTREVQKILYESFLNELKSLHPKWRSQELNKEAGKFVAYPYDKRFIPHHLTGGAADLTLVEDSGEELDMGTGFDDFGEKAASLYYEKRGSDTKIKDNRRRLREALEGEEFYNFPLEWWHFDYGDQIWAFAYKKPQAMYGEVKIPN